MIGIYKVIDLRNQKVIYVGQSIDIEDRICQHKRRTQQLIDQYIHNEGLDNFSFETIEICDVSQLEEREIYWISFYNTMRPNGYNCVLGTPVGYNSIGENNTRACVNEEQVRQMREQCQTKTKLEVWKNYSNLISYDAFRKIIDGMTWKHLPILDSKPELRSDRKRCKLTEEQVKDIRYRSEVLKQSRQEISQTYNWITTKSISRILNYETWKNIDNHGNREFKNNKFPRSKVSPDDVREIRRRANLGESGASISKDYPQISQSAVRLIINHKTWKNIE